MAKQKVNGYCSLCIARCGTVATVEGGRLIRPGTDGALALGLANVMIRRDWYDRGFVRDWSNGPHLVRADTGKLLRASELAAGGDARHYARWDRHDGIASRHTISIRPCWKERPTPFAD